MPESQSASITLNVFDGARQLIDPQLKKRVILRNGAQQVKHDDFHRAPSIHFNVPFHNSAEDNYTVVVSASKHTQAGFSPIKASPLAQQVVDLMIVPKKCDYDFTEAAWNTLAGSRPGLSRLLAAGVSADEAANRYDRLMAGRADSLACLLNIATALDDLPLPGGAALDFYRELIWEVDLLRRDRFFAFADARLLGEIERAAQQGVFGCAPLFELTHPGATKAYKQTQFGAGNLEICFHEGTRRNIGGVDCVKVETDMDYFRDPLAHFFLEVLKNALSGSKTDPKAVYVCRWIESRRPGMPEFDPPFRLVRAAEED